MQAQSLRIWRSVSSFSGSVSGTRKINACIMKLTPYNDHLAA
jgi:hypothetical protein